MGERGGERGGRERSVHEVKKKEKIYKEKREKRKDNAETDM